MSFWNYLVFKIRDDDYGGFGGHKPPKTGQQPLPPPPDIEDPTIEAARRRERERLRKKRGRGASILTGPQGVTGFATIGQKTLLGE